MQFDVGTPFIHKYIDFFSNQQTIHAHRHAREMTSSKLNLK